MQVQPVTKREAAPARGSGTQTLERGLDLLERAILEPMKLPDLLARSSLTRSTTKRLLQCLLDRRFLALAPNQQIRAGATLLQLSAVAQSSCDLLGIARAHLDALSARTGLSAFLGRREGKHSVHVHRTPGTQRVLVGTPVGTRRLLPETSLGKALLLDDGVESWRRLLAETQIAISKTEWEAAMRRSRADGVVLHEGPAPEAIRAVAAPVRDAQGTIVGAVSVATVAQYLDLDQMTELAPIVRSAAEAISGELGWRPALA
jgi:DNA-binding IclR family transcriptional regulator